MWLTRYSGGTGVWENRGWVGWGMQERKRVRGGSSKRVGSRRNTCRGKLCRQCLIFCNWKRATGRKPTKKGSGVQGVGDLDFHFPPINAIAKILAIGYSQRSLKFFPLRSNYDRTIISHSNFTFKLKILWSYDVTIQMKPLLADRLHGALYFLGLFRKIAFFTFRGP